VESISRRRTGSSAEVEEKGFAGKTPGRENENEFMRLIWFLVILQGFEKVMNFLLEISREARRG
jgi:hypothetical protein